MNQASNESNVRGYSRSFPTVFNYSKNDILKDINDKEYIDFFSGAGALNYGHNNSLLKQEIIEFLQNNSPVHCLDMDSLVKLKFLNKFNDTILQPRGLEYKLQFPSPSGTNAVEAAIKLARKVTKRSKILSFTHSYHGMTASSLALSGSQETKHSYIPSQDVIFFPFDGFMGKEIDAFAYLEKMLSTKGSGIEMPAAIILETIQAEGGINIATNKWLLKLENFAKRNGIILIIDDIQVGCGRTGTFFSFERAGIYPDIVLLSKSISGFGLPLSLILLKPALDIWEPGEHNGTFRANNLALCSASKALDYWTDKTFSDEIRYKSDIISQNLSLIGSSSTLIKEVRGVGFIWGVEFNNPEVAPTIARTLFEKGMIIETCGNQEQVIKLLPPLTITVENLTRGLNMMKEVIYMLESKEEEVLV